MSTIKVGDKVRSFDFEGRDLTGERAAYVEGVVQGIQQCGQVSHYEILVTRAVFRGEECPDRVGIRVFPPVNGVPKLFGGLTDGVVLS